MPAEREAGFTLIEVLVALLMAAVLTTILLNGAALARTRAAQAGNRQKAIFLARSVLARAVTAPFGRSPASGDVNGFTWVLQEQSILADPRGLYALAELTVQVSDGRNHLLFAASTRRLKTIPRS